MKRCVFALVFASMLLACTRPDQRSNETSQQAGGAAAPGDWIIVRYEVDPETLNPLLFTTAAAGRALYGVNYSQIFETLLQYDPADWSFTKPVLAESYPEISPDHLTYTFTIRERVQWHDGRPFSADDVLFSIKVLMSPLADTARLRGYFLNLVDVQIVESRKVRFTFSKPNFLNANNLGGEALGIIPKHVFDPAGLLDNLTYKDMIGPKGQSAAVKKFAEEFHKHPANRVPIGTGPYRFERWESGKELTLVRNDAYWGRKAYLQKIVFRVIQDYPAALTALKAGDVDFNPRMTPIQYAQQTSGQQFESQFVKATHSPPQYAFIVWNADRPFFKDKRVRQAMTMLIDRRQIIQTLRFGLGKLTESHFNPSSPDYNKNLKPYPYDPARAAQLLDEAGWKDANGDGIREKDGVPFRFTFLGSAGSTFTDQLLPILKEELRKVGIEMLERRLEFTVMIKNLRDRQFDASTLMLVSPLVADPYETWHSSSIANRGSNYAGFRNAEADRLLEEARMEFDADKRRQLYWRWQEIVHEEQPYTFLYVPEDPAAYHKRFQNVVWQPPDPGYDLNQWFVPQSLQKYALAPAN